MKYLYLAGASLEAVKEVCQGIRGILALVPGRVLCTSAPVKVVRVDYDPKKIDIGEIMAIFFQIVYPYCPKPTPVDFTDENRKGVYYSSGEDTFQVEYFIRYLMQRGQESNVALDSLIVNDSVTPGKEPRFSNLDIQRINDFTATGPELVLD